MKTLRAVDLFCGAGGSSSGLAKACERLGHKLHLVAVNHWEMAIQTHSKNHPSARHLCEPIDQFDPRRAVPEERIDLLWASPECTHHSIARGGKPINDQSRATAWCILRWAEALQPATILIENVREWEFWGPLGSTGRPLKSRRGETFRAFIAAIESLGYRTDYRILNAADYGDPTTRERLFVQAQRGRRPIVWPEPTHSRTGEASLFGQRHQWRAAREVIDWSIPGTSIFNRKRPLKPNTLRRIEAGIKRFWGRYAEPFLVVMREGAERRVRSLDEPVPTITAGNKIMGLVEPFVIGQQSGAVPRRVEHPLPTIATEGAIRLVTPFVVPTNYGERPGQTPRSHDIDSPLPTVVGTVAHGIVSPFLVKYNATGGPQSVDDPLDTISTRDRFGLVEGAYLDILFRMLQPHELAQAMGFPASYQFAGNRGEMVRQIGNAVCVGVAEALCLAALGGAA